MGDRIGRGDLVAKRGYHRDELGGVRSLERRTFLVAKRGYPVANRG